MIIQKRTLNWLPKPSLYAEQQAKRDKMKSNHDEFLSNTSSFFDSYSTIQSDSLVQTGQLVSKIAVARITSKLA
jgi:hypothetical protein